MDAGVGGPSDREEDATGCADIRRTSHQETGAEEAGGALPGMGTRLSNLSGNSDPRLRSRLSPAPRTPPTSGGKDSTDIGHALPTVEGGYPPVDSTSRERF